MNTLSFENKLESWQRDPFEIHDNILYPSENGESLYYELLPSFQLIQKNPIGQRLLEKIEDLIGTIYLTKSNENQAIYFKNKKIVVITLTFKNSLFYTIDGVIRPTPFYVIFFHELIHAYHFLSGKNAKTCSTDPILWESDEEYKTIIGFPSKKSFRNKPKITENSFRKADNIPERFGSWDPLAKSVGHKLFQIRFGLLTQKYKNSLLDCSSNSPPRITVCTKEDLYFSDKYILYVCLKLENGVVNLGSENMEDYYIMDTSNSFQTLIGEKCYHTIWPSAETNIDILKDFIEQDFPHLRKLTFTITKMVVLRLSLNEFSLLTPQS